MNCEHAEIAALYGGRCPWCATPATEATSTVENKSTAAQSLVSDQLRPPEAITDQKPTVTSRAADPATTSSPEITPDVAGQILERFDEVACKGSLAEFVKLAWLVLKPGLRLEWGRHIDAVCAHVQAQLEDRWRAMADPTYRMRAQNLVINVPPRSLKTFILVCAMAWAWVRDPRTKIMYLSANPRVARAGARAFRDLIASPWFQRTFLPKWELREDQDALSDMGNTDGGTLRAIGLDADITGEGGDWQIIDDPHDLRDSRDTIKECVEGFDSAVANRLNDPRTSIRTQIMQRVSDEDLAARVLALSWVLHLRLPMEFEPAGSLDECACGTCSPANDNAYGFRDWRKRKNEVLHRRFTAEFLAAERLRLGTRGYATQMQQRPAPPGGNMFKVAHWGFHTVTQSDLPRVRPKGARESASEIIPRRPKDGSLDLDWLCISIDATSGSTSDSASDLGIGIIGGRGNKIYVLEDRTDGPATWNQTRERSARAILRAGEIAGRQKRVTVLLEKKAMGASDDAPLPTSLREMLGEGVYRREDGTELQLHYPDGSKIIAKLELYEPTGKGDKVQRAEAMEPDQEAGLITLEDGAPWVPAFVEQMAAFPRGSHDDRVDYMSQAIDHHRAPVAAILKADWSRLARASGGR